MSNFRLPAWRVLRQTEALDDFREAVRRLRALWAMYRDIQRGAKAAGLRGRYLVMLPVRREIRAAVGVVRRLSVASAVGVGPIGGADPDHASNISSFFPAPQKLGGRKMSAQRVASKGEGSPCGVDGKACGPGQAGGVTGEGARASGASSAPQCDVVSGEGA